jgi:hypothetical protein
MLKSKARNSWSRLMADALVSIGGGKDWAAGAAGDISDQADLHLLGQKLRCAPIQMEIDAAGISGSMILGQYQMGSPLLVGSQLFDFNGTGAFTYLIEIKFTWARRCQA